MLLVVVAGQLRTLLGGLFVRVSGYFAAALPLDRVI